MGKPQDDIRHILQDKAPDERLRKVGTWTADRIVYFKLTTKNRSGCTIVVEKTETTNRNDLKSPPEVIEDFFAGKRAKSLTESASVYELELMDILTGRKSAKTAEKEAGADTPSDFDISADQRIVVCIDTTDIGGLFIDPKILSFEEIGGSKDHLIFYGDCVINTSTMKQMAFSVEGGAALVQSAKLHKGHKFNLHFVFTDEGEFDINNRKITEVIFDPKVRDPGGD